MHVLCTTNKSKILSIALCHQRCSGNGTWNECKPNRNWRCKWKSHLIEAVDTIRWQIDILYAHPCTTNFIIIQCSTCELDEKQKKDFKREIACLESGLVSRTQCLRMCFHANKKRLSERGTDNYDSKLDIVDCKVRSMTCVTNYQTRSVNYETGSSTLSSTETLEFSLVRCAMCEIEFGLI